MARQINYSMQPISTRVDPRGRYYARLETGSLTPEETLRGIMAYKKITAYSESTVMQLLTDLLQGAIELTSLDGYTRTIGQMLRVYMSLEGSYASPELSATDKDNLIVKTQLLKDLKYPVDGSNFTLSLRDDITPKISLVHYSGQTSGENAIAFGMQCIITGKNLDRIIPQPGDGEHSPTAINLYNLDNLGSSVELGVEETYKPSYNAAVLDIPTHSGGGVMGTIFPGDGPWRARIELKQEGVVWDSKDVTAYKFNSDNN